MKSITKNIVLSAMFLAIGLILPLFTAQIPQIGQMLLPMHIPVCCCAGSYAAGRAGQLWGLCFRCCGRPYSVCRCSSPPQSAWLLS